VAQQTPAVAPGVVLAECEECGEGVDFCEVRSF